MEILYRFLVPITYTTFITQLLITLIYRKLADDSLLLIKLLSGLPNVEHLIIKYDRLLTRKIANVKLILINVQR